MLMTTPVAVGENLNITMPGEIEGLNGGETRTTEFIVTYTGSGNAECRITYEILPNGDGINITYSPNVFTISANSQQTIVMTINASMLLQPGDYAITTKISGETSASSGNNGYPSHRSGGNIVIIQAVDYDEEPGDDIPIPNDSDITDDIIDEHPPKPMAPNNFMYFICIGIIFFIIILLVCIKGKRRQKKNETNKKKH
jgi:hypothetical protein